MSDAHLVPQPNLRGIPLSENMFANPTARRPLNRVKAGIGVALAAIATIGLGAGVAAAAPQQPFLADDPLPVPGLGGADAGAGSAVNIANSLFGSLSGLMNNIIPGSGDLLMPASSALSPGGLPGGMPGGLPGALPGQLPGGLPGYPGGLPGQLPGGLPGYPGGLPGQMPGYPGALPGQTPGFLPGQTPGGLPGQTPGCLPGQTPGGLPGQTPGFLPGQTPGGLPGQTPGCLPGQTPGGLPGQTPGFMPGQTPGVAGQTLGFPGSRPRSCRSALGRLRSPRATQHPTHGKLTCRYTCEEDQLWPSVAARRKTASTARPTTVSAPTPRRGGTEITRLRGRWGTPPLPVH